MRRNAALAVLLFACACSTAVPDRAVPQEWLTLPRHSPPMDARREGMTTTGPIAIVEVGSGKALANGLKILTPAFEAIDSFDYSPERKEVVFSARHGGDNFDVGLVSADGSDVHWVPSDPADEVDVRWGTRANVVSYLVRASGGDLIRTVHVPTATAVSADVHGGTIISYGWVGGERIRVAWSSLTSSPRVEEMTYDGRDRKLTSPPAMTLDVETEPVAEALVLRPGALRYNETLPLVVWRQPQAGVWDDARGALEKGSRLACAVVDREPDPAFWDAIGKIRWIDRTRIYTVGLAARAGATSIVGDDAVPAGRYRREGSVVRVAPALVESLAAGMIAAELKGNPPTNGRPR